MSEEIEQVSEVETDDEFDQEEIFEKMKEVIEKEKTEYPNSSLFSMVIDSVSGKRSIFKINAEIEEAILQEDFAKLE